MGEFVLTRLRSKFLRRSSTSSVKIPPASPTTSASGNDNTAFSDQGDLDTAPIFTSAPSTPDLRGRRASSARSTSTLDRSTSPRLKRLQKSARSRPTSEPRPIESSKDSRENHPRLAEETVVKSTKPPQLTLQEPTPDQVALTPLHQRREVNVIEEEFGDAVEDLKEETTPADPQSSSISAPISPPPPPRPVLAERAQSLISAGQQGLIKELLQSERPGSRSSAVEYLSGVASLPVTGMVQRKVWVKRPGASATLVTVSEDDVVDDVREAILRKYGNSLGRNLDAPDITLRIVARESAGQPRLTERNLGPEEQICRTLDAYYPNSQTVEDALVIEIPQRRTPRPSPRHGYSMPHYMSEEIQRGEPTEYFPPMPVITSPHLAASNHSGSVHHQPIHAMSVLSTGQIPTLPSPGGRMYREGKHRPKYGRNHTSSPTVLNSIPPSQQLVDVGSQLVNGVQAPAPPPLPTPPPAGTEQKSSHTPPGRVSSPRPGQKPRRSRRSAAPKDTSITSPSAGLLDGTVPPINVLIVEDNVINLRLLEAFIRKLKVRWKTAVNGREAVNKWRTGGFHLVLMDIQLPIMSGLEATREIRRLERINNIGVFSSPFSTDQESPSAEKKAEEAGEKMKDGKYQPEGDDVLESRELFKSPVIVVALTASSLQSDRHEALAAGCNDFLTKPVNFDWLERKVTEWGCMQALIDFDGWRKWKDFSTNASTTGSGDASATGTSPNAVSNSNSAPAKTKRKPITIRRKKDSIDKTERKGSVTEKQESAPLQDDSPAASRSRNESSGTTDAEGRKSESGASSSPSTRDKSSSDASRGSGSAAVGASSVGENTMLSVQE